MPSDTTPCVCGHAHDAHYALDTDTDSGCGVQFCPCGEYRPTPPPAPAAAEPYSRIVATLRGHEVVSPGVCHAVFVGDDTERRAAVYNNSLNAAHAAGLAAGAARERARWEGVATEAQEVLALMDDKGERAGFIDARVDPAVLALCERVGYGAVMDSAARQWFRKDPIGAFVCGPCAKTVADLKASLAAAMGPPA